MNDSLPNSAGDRPPLEPMDPQIRDIQPGGGWVMRLELAWGRWRRWWLKSFRKSYVERMRACRVGEPTGVPHEVLDPRDLKFHRNQTDCHWQPHDDPFVWRDRLPFARVGLAELLVFSLLLWTPAVVLAAVAGTAELSGGVRLFLWFLAGALGLLGLEIPWFFRDPRRRIPTEPGVVVAPADGHVVRIDEVEDEFVGGPAILIRIFLSVFNVHINRAPVAGKVIGLEYQPGKYLNALLPESAAVNEKLVIRLEATEFPHRRMVVRQIAGALARRIVCWLKPGDELARGEQFGMIKLGSTTDLVLPKDGLTIRVKLGDSVKAGSSIVARYDEQ